MPADWLPAQPLEPATPTAPGVPCAPLSTLTTGEECIVIAVLDEDVAQATRLKTLGVHEGRRLRVQRGGNPMVVACGATRIGLSATIARQVLVREMAVP